MDLRDPQHEMMVCMRRLRAIRAMVVPRPSSNTCRCANPRRVTDVTTTGSLRATGCAGPRRLGTAAMTSCYSMPLPDTEPDGKIRHPSRPFPRATEFFSPAVRRGHEGAEDTSRYRKPSIASGKGGARCKVAMARSPLRQRLHHRSRSPLADVESRSD